MKLDNYDDIKVALFKILEEKYRFNASIDIYITLSLNARTMEKAKKQVSFSIIYPHVACNPKETVILTDGVTEGFKSFSYVAASKIKKPNFEVIIARTGDINKISSVLKILGQKKIMPNVDNATLVSNESQLKERYHEFASGKRNIIKLLVGQSVTNLYTSIGTISSTVEDMVENLVFLLSTIDKRFSSISKKPIKIKSMYISSTMGESRRIVV